MRKNDLIETLNDRLEKKVGVFRFTKCTNDYIELWWKAESISDDRLMAVKNTLDHLTGSRSCSTDDGRGFRIDWSDINDMLVDNFEKDFDANVQALLSGKYTSSTIVTHDNRVTYDASGNANINTGNGCCPNFRFSFFSSWDVRANVGKFMPCLGDSNNHSLLEEQDVEASVIPQNIP